MRNTLAVAFVCALGMVSACAWGEGAPTDDDDDDDGQQTDDNTDDDGSSGDDSTPLPVCGDGTCASSEISSCSADCGAAATCGDGTCGGGETQSSCPSDCTPTATCGDGTCDTAAGETTGSCPGDCSGGMTGQCPADPNECLFCLFEPSLCPAGLDQAACEACIGGGGGGLGDIGCTGGAPDGTCDADEDADICPSDCP
jgi:hypothetical protein